MRILAFPRKESFKYYDDRIAKVNQEKLELEKRYKEKEDEEASLLEQRRDFGMREYTKARREIIISEAESEGYSEEAVDRLKEYNESSWNQDTITNDVINDFIDASNFIIKHKKYRKSIFYKIGDIIEGSDDEN